MKKIFLFVASACALVACDPVQEDICNDGHITLAELKSMSSVTVDKAENGKNGNVITCESSAPANIKWNVGYVDSKNAGKAFTNSYAKQKMLVGDYNVLLTAVCADGTVLVDTFKVSCEEITNPLTRVYIYGDPAGDQPAFKPGAWDAAAMRFSDNEGRCQYGTEVVENDEDGKFNATPLYTNLPYLSDDVYWGCKTLIFDLSDVSADCSGRIMNGWWSARYDGNNDVHWTNGLWELPLTATIAQDCARGNGGDGKDLDIMVTSGSMTVNAIYYEE